MMEYVAMLTSPDLVSGLSDLLKDTEVVVVKRTIRVFANVYRHALRLLAEGELDEATFTTSWPAVQGVAHYLVDMLATTENEGVTVHVVRFLEAALVAHLLSDVSRYPAVAAHGPDMISKGVAALTELISTPYIGGSAFLVGVRALITVACYKPDLWTPVTELIQKQIASPPPTLFDHNVRSLHKTLQRNLFRLLRRAESPALRRQLIEMMVTVGVPRRMLSQWAPPPEARKRPAQTQSEEAITGRSSPPNKRPRSDDKEAGTESVPRDPREGRLSRDPRINGLVRDPRERRDPRTVVRSDSRNTVPQDPRTTASGHDPPSSKSTSPPASPSTTPEPRTTITTSTTSMKNDKKIMSNFEFLKSLITSRKKASCSFLDRCSEKERALYERLDHPSVVRLVLSCLDSVPDSPPEDLLGKLGRNTGDVAGIREQLTSLMAPHIHHDFISSLTDEESSAPPSRPSSNASSSRCTPPLHNPPSPPSPPSSARSTPSDPAQVCHSDVDLRHLLNRGFHATADVDMRDTRNLLPRESPAPTATPTPAAPLSQHPDQRPPIPTSTRLDPRVAMAHPGLGPAGSEVAPSGGLDPRITQSFADAHNPAMASSGGPFMASTAPHPIQPPPHGYMPGFMQGARSPFMEGMRPGFDMTPGYEPQYPGPPPHPMGVPHDVAFMGHRGVMGGPRGMGGPWQDRGVPHNRMGVMMPLMNGGSGMFSPPMHL